MEGCIFVLVSSVRYQILHVAYQDSKVCNPRLTLFFLRFATEKSKKGENVTKIKNENINEESKISFILLKCFFSQCFCDC